MRRQALPWPRREPVRPGLRSSVSACCSSCGSAWRGHPLTPDEAYYRLWAQQPSLGYYDHPPGVAWAIWLGVQLFGDTALGVRASHDVISPRALIFALVGLSGVAVHLCALYLMLRPLGLSFAVADLLAAFVAMGGNYVFNNELTYRDRRRSGLAFLAGFPRFAAICSVGLLINVAIALQVRQQLGDGRGAAAAGAGLAAIWNYAVTSLLLW